MATANPSIQITVNFFKDLDSIKKDVNNITNVSVEINNGISREDLYKAIVDELNTTMGDNKIDIESIKVFYKNEKNYLEVNDRTISKIFDSKEAFVCYKGM